MSQLRVHLPPVHRRVLEFGSGLGGNLVALSSEFEQGIGLDVNRGFVRIAARLTSGQYREKIRFLWYDGKLVPRFHDGFDVIFSIGVFERLARDVVERSVRDLASQLNPGGRLLLYFLSTRAAGQPLVERLGVQAYTLWTRQEIAGLLSRAGLRVVTLEDWYGWDSSAAARRLAKPADLCVATLPEAAS